MIVLNCSQIYRRQHQLRVHLEALGFPIHNDVLYGGKVDNNQQNEMKNQAIMSIIESRKYDKSHISINEDSITNEVIKEAKEVSLCYTGNEEDIQQAFNSAQLLMEGHAIDLHALSYRIRFYSKYKKKVRENSDEVPLTNLELNVNPPSWCTTTRSFIWLDK